jgi:hypothetical protein
MEKVKKTLKVLLRVYAGICIFITTLLIVSVIIAWTNFGKIAAFAIEIAEDNSNTELKSIFMEYFPEGITPINLIQFINDDGVSKITLAVEKREEEKIESLVSVTRPKDAAGANVPIYINIDGETVGVIENGQEISLPVKNGRHIIRAVHSVTLRATPELVFETEFMNVMFSVGFNSFDMYFKKINEEPYLHESL